MIRSQSLLGDCARPLVERLGLAVSALTHMKYGKIIEQRADCRMVRTQHLFVDGECSLVKGFDLGGAALRPISQTQPVEALPHLSMVRAELFFEHAMRAL